MRLYYIFFDLDGSLQVVRVVSETRFLTHRVMESVIVDCLPSEKCHGIIEKLVKVVVPNDIDRYIFAQFTACKANFYIVSGVLKAYKGYLAFFPAYDYGTFINTLSKGGIEQYYRDLYVKSMDYVKSLLDRFKTDMERNLDHVDKITESYRDILKKFNEYMEKTVGFIARAPETLTIAEAGLAQLTAPPPPPAPPAPPTPPPKPSFIEKVKGFFGRLLWRKRA